MQNYLHKHVRKSKTKSLEDKITEEEEKPSTICLVETHLEKGDTVEIERYSLTFRNDKSSDSGETHLEKVTR